MGQIRERLYNFNLTFGLFCIMPFISRLPDSIGRILLMLRTIFRFFFSDYRAYVNRPGLKKIAIKNLSETFNIERKIAKRKIFRLMYLEVIGEKNGFLLDKYSLPTLNTQFYIEGIDMLHAALKKGRGVIFTTIHSGDTVLFMLFLGLMGYDIYGLFDEAIYKGVTTDPLHRFAIVKDQKITGRIGKLYTGKGLMKVYDVLSQNGIVVWMVDLPVQNKKRGKTVDFLGSRILVSDAFWHVALKSGASIIPHVSVYNFKMHRHDVFIGSSIEPSRDTIQDLFNFYDTCIRQYPESWIGWYYLDILKKLD